MDASGIQPPASLPVRLNVLSPGQQEEEKRLVWSGLSVGLAIGSLALRQPVRQVSKALEHFSRSLAPTFRKIKETFPSLGAGAC